MSASTDDTDTDNDNDFGETGAANQFDIGPSDDASPFERKLWNALDEIPDPHIPVSLVDMAMIYDVSVDGGDVTVEMTYPCLGCPAYDMIQNDVTSCLRVFDGVERVEVEVVWDPVWSKEMLSEKARRELREAGIGL